MNKAPKICVVTCPQPEAGVVPLSNLIEILLKLAPSLYLITGNEGQRVLKGHPEVKGYSISYKQRTSPVARLIAHLFLQLKIAARVLRTSNKVDMYLFFFGESLVLPFWAGKIARKTVVLSLPGSVKKIATGIKDPFSKLATLMENSNYRYADRIVVYSPHLVDDWGMHRFSKKIAIAHEHFIDFRALNIHNKQLERDYSVGYIGRFSKEKGPSILSGLYRLFYVQVLISGS